MPLATRSGSTARRSVVLPLLWRPTNAIRGAFTAAGLCGERCPALDAELRAFGVRLPAVRAELARPGRSGRGRCEWLGVLLLGLVAERADALAELAEDRRELPRSEHDEHDHQDEDELRSTDGGHGHFLVRAWARGIYLAKCMSAGATG